MTTMYRPVLIESVEQAEALPVGTLVIEPNHQELAEATDYGPGSPAVRCRHYEPSCTWFSDYEGSVPASSVIGWTALVPIKVEVEQIRESGGRRRAKTLYITPWALPDPDGPADEAQALADCGDQA